MAAMTKEQWRTNAWRIAREHTEFLEAMRLAEIRSALVKHERRKN